MTSTDYDIIVIGSGMGGLTVASLMAQLRDKPVLVIEKHNVGLQESGETAKVTP